MISRRKSRASPLINAARVRPRIEPNRLNLAKSGRVVEKGMRMATMTISKKILSGTQTKTTMSTNSKKRKMSRFSSFGGKKSERVSSKRMKPVSTRILTSREFQNSRSHSRVKTNISKS